METSRIDGVKAPQHRGTLRSHRRSSILGAILHFQVLRVLVAGHVVVAEGVAPFHALALERFRFRDAPRDLCVRNGSNFDQGPRLMATIHGVKAPQDAEVAPIRSELPPKHLSSRTGSRSRDRL